MEFDKNAYRTPRYLVNWIARRFGGVWVDGCANEHNAVFDVFIGQGSGYTDFLDFDPLDMVMEYADASIAFFVNPPYSNPEPFVERAAALRQQGYLVVMLLPADKSTRWYQVIHDNATEVIDIIGGRINFIHPITGEEVKGNNKGPMVVVFDPMIEGLVTRQVRLDFIKKCGA